MIRQKYIWFGYFLLFGLTIPWYWQFFPAETNQLWLGMPRWAASAVVGSGLISIYTAWLLRYPWPDESDSMEELP